MLTLNGASGAGALNQMPAFTAANFALSTDAVPEPSSFVMLGGGMVLMALGLMRR